MNEIIRSEAATNRVAERQGGIMEGSLDMQAEDSGTSNLIREGEQGEAETAEGMGSMPCQNTVTNSGGENTLNTKKQQLLETVLDIMEGARHNLPQFPGMRDEIEYWNAIVEAWEQYAGKYLIQGEMEEEEWEEGWEGEVS